MGRDGGMDLGRAFSYVFQDPQWVKKALIALVMLVIPIVGWLILYGYMLRIMRQTALGVDVPLPEWDDFGGDFVRGFKGYVIQFIWYLPVLIVGFCIQFAFGLLGAAAGRGTEAETIRTLLTVCANCLSFILGLMFAFIAPVFITRFAVTDRFAAAFALSEIFNETGRSVVNLLIVLIVSILLGILALFGVLLCVVGILATLLYALFVQAHLYGQVRRRLAAGGESAAAPSPVMPTA